MVRSVRPSEPFMLPSTHMGSLVRAASSVATVHPKAQTAYALGFPGTWQCYPTGSCEPLDSGRQSAQIHSEYTLWSFLSQRAAVGFLLAE